MEGEKNEQNRPRLRTISNKGVKKGGPTNEIAPTRHTKKREPRRGQCAVLRAPVVSGGGEPVSLRGREERRRGFVKMGRRNKYGGGMEVGGTQKVVKR